jgi:hypothetical protein
MCRVGALANRACKEPAVAHYTCLLAKALEKGLRSS